MCKYTLPNAPEFSVFIKRSSRARRMTLRISSVERCAKVTAPLSIDKTQITRFVQKNEGWLRRQLSALPEIQSVTIGSAVPLEGADHFVKRHSGQCVTVRDGYLLVPQRTKIPNRAILAYMKETCRRRISAAADGYTKKRMTSYKKLTLRDTRSRWGSCTEQGHLMFSWRLIMAPASVLNYVVAHEVAHLEEMNHSKAFWSLTEALFGDYSKERAWLHENGSYLHSFRF